MQINTYKYYIQRKVTATRCCTGENLSLELALPSFGIAQTDHPSAEARQDADLLAWAVGSGGTIRLWLLSSKVVSLPAHR